MGKRCLQPIWILSLLIISGVSGCKSGTDQPAFLEKPNIIVIVADDLGWSDLSSYGNDFIETPHLDQLASKGIRFTNGYAPASLCSPSRASIVTGLHPVRVNITEHIHGNQPAGPNQKLKTPPIDQSLKLEHYTTAEAVKREGYTTAYIGKWHLGGGEFRPTSQGFDHTYAANYHGLPNTFHFPFFNHAMDDIKADSEPGDYLTDKLTDHFIDYIGEVEGEFLAYLNFYSPHVPIEGPTDLVEKYVEKAGGVDDGPIPNPHYAAMVESIDRNVGRLVDSLDSFGLLENTVIFFTSDNGGLSVQEVPAFAKHTPPTDNFPLNEGKGYLYEGGIRVPFIIYNETLFQGGDNHTPVSGTDIHNTILDLLERHDFTSDGKSLLPITRGEDQIKPIFFHVPHYSPQGGLPASAIRKGDYKLIYFYEEESHELYNLVKDPEELNNLANTEIEIKEDLLRELQEWKARVEAKNPSPNPNYLGD